METSGRLHESEDTEEELLQMETEWAEREREETSVETTILYGCLESHFIQLYYVFSIT